MNLKTRKILSLLLFFSTINYSVSAMKIPKPPLHFNNQHDCIKEIQNRNCRNVLKCNIEKNYQIGYLIYLILRLKNKHKSISLVWPNGHRFRQIDRRYLNLNFKSILDSDGKPLVNVDYNTTGTIARLKIIKFNTALLEYLKDDVIFVYSKTKSGANKFLKINSCSYIHNKKSRLCDLDKIKEIGSIVYNAIFDIVSKNPQKKAITLSLEDIRKFNENTKNNLS